MGQETSCPCRYSRAIARKVKSMTKGNTLLLTASAATARAVAYAFVARPGYSGGVRPYGMEI
jgi:hypothetical protein